jgi:hypothetical protein
MPGRLLRLILDEGSQFTPTQASHFFLTGFSRRHLQYRIKPRVKDPFKK